MHVEIHFPDIYASKNVSAPPMKISIIIGNDSRYPDLCKIPEIELDQVELSHCERLQVSSLQFHNYLLAFVFFSQRQIEHLRETVNTLLVRTPQNANEEDKENRYLAINLRPIYINHSAGG